MRKAHPAFKMQTAAQINDNIYFFETDPGIVGYQINGNAVNDSWQQIQVWFNGSNIEKTISPLKKHNYKAVIVNNQFVSPVIIDLLALEPYTCTVIYSN
jgi:pullulanase